MPPTGDPAEIPGRYVDEHGHLCEVEVGMALPGCPDGATFWWHEDLPVARHMVWEAERRAQSGLPRDSGR